MRFGAEKDPLSAYVGKQQSGVSLATYKGKTVCGVGFFAAESVSRGISSAEQYLVVFDLHWVGFNAGGVVFQTAACC